MEKSLSNTTLIRNDQLDVWDSGDLENCLSLPGCNTDSEGSSSGYESCHECNVYKRGIDSSLPCDRRYSGSCDTEVEIMNYKSTHALCDNLKYILSMPELCDIMFYVGPNKIPVCGVKAIMATRSRAFYNLILKYQHENEEIAKQKQTYLNTFPKKPRRLKHNHKLVINVRKYDPNVFRSIVQFVHCGNVDVTTYNVTGLLCGASQFGLTDLEEACWDYVERSLQHCCYGNLIKSAQKYTYSIK